MKNHGIAYLQNEINQIYGQIGVGERNEPQLPKAAVLGYMGNASAQNSWIQTSNERYQMNHRTSMFIANGMNGQKQNMGPKLYNPKTLPGPCYECGGDHWVKYCPNLKQELKPIPKNTSFNERM